MNRKHYPIFLMLFFVSGACGLVYEIVWSRLLVFVFGGTTFAITTVLSCFMGGLALGSYVAGRLSHRIDRPAVAYGVLEIGIGVYCLAVPFLLDLALPIYQFLARVSGDSFFLLTLARVVVCGCVLVVPTAFMGATLPLLSKAFVDLGRELGVSVARLYGINTIGAFVGCAGAGFLFLPILGLSKSILLAALLNVSAGATAVLLAGWTFRSATSHDATSETQDLGARTAPPGALPSLRPSALLWLYGLSGFAAMAYQVAWTRALILSMGASTYAFSSIVAAFILGIAVGSLLISAWISRIRSPLALAGLLEGIIALSALIVVPLFGEMPGLVQRLRLASGATFESLLLAEAACVLGLLIVPTFCMGAILPLVCAAYEAMRAAREPDGAQDASGRRSTTAGRSVGAVYASNTVGTILGAAITGFVLIPWSSVGMQRTIVIASALSGLIATAFVLRGPSWRRDRARLGLGLGWTAGIALALVAQPWSKAVMVSGPYLGRGTSQRAKVVFYREGIDTTVAVTQSDEGIVSLLVNGKPDASNGTLDRLTQALLGHIPLFLRPGASDVCVIGLGSGDTAGAILAHGVERVDVAEISGAVVEAATYFSDINNNALNDPRCALYRADGRNFLLTTDKTYDVIVSEPSNPWISGVANLFTREFFEIAKNRLKPGGLHCQWLHAYSMSPDDFAAVLKTMSTVFSHIQVWDMGPNNFPIMGSDSPIVLDVESLYFTMQKPGVSASMNGLRINDPMQLANHYVADGEHLSSWIDRRSCLTDDVPRLEFSAPRSLIKGELRLIERALFCIDPLPALAGSAARQLNEEFTEKIKRSRRAKQLMNGLVAGSQEAADAPARFLEIVNTAPDDMRVFVHVAYHVKKLSQQTLTPDGTAVLERLYAEIAEAAPGISALGHPETGTKMKLEWPFARKVPSTLGPREKEVIDQAKALYEKGEKPAALRRAREAAGRFPHHPVILGQAGVWALEVEGPEAAIPFLLKAWNMWPDHPLTNYHLARAYGLRSDRDRALTFLEAAIKNGFKDRAAIESSELAKRLQNDPRFRSLLSHLPGSDRN